jgi:hypothetical protein
MKQKLRSFYAIRCVAVGPGYSNKRGGVKSPFEVGAYMQEYYNGYGGRSMETVRHPQLPTFFETRIDAQALLDKCVGYNATFEIIEFVEKGTKK